MANPNQHQIDEDDPDILALREMALSSLVSKDKKKASLNEATQIISAPMLFQHEQQHHANFHHENFQPQFPLPSNGMGPMSYRGHRPPFGNHEPYPAPVQRMYNPMYRPQMHQRPTFAPRRPNFPAGPPMMMPIVQPHLNPNFIAQHPHLPRFAPTGPELPPMHVAMALLEKEEDMPLMPEMNGATFSATPPSRLSPRSAEFVAKNNEAMRLQQLRSFSPGRSRSRSPYKYRRSRSRSRSRSPQHKPQVSHIARKRTRSKTPENYPGKFNRKSRSPRRRSKSPEKRLSPKYPEKRNRNNKYNGNGANREKFAKQESERNRRVARSPPKPVDKEKNESGSSDEKKKGEKMSPKSSSPAPKEAKEIETENHEKTEQELEDELLASTDSDSIDGNDVIDDDEFKVTLDDKDLDFLDDDDDEESENEGRFKSKPASSTQQKKSATTSSFKSSYASKNNDKPRNYGSGDQRYPRNDYKRGRYNDKEREKRSPIDRVKDRTPPRKHKKSPEVRKSPEVSRVQASKEPAQTSRVIVINKEDSKKVKDNKPLFKATFQSVEPPVEDKPKGKYRRRGKRNFELTKYRLDEEPKKDERIRLVRGSVISRIEPLKSDKKKESRPAIMKRLGGYIKDPGTKAAKAWVKEQPIVNQAELNHLAKASRSFCSWI